jgi:hypothetical protein
MLLKARTGIDLTFYETRHIPWALTSRDHGIPWLP